MADARETDAPAKVPYHYCEKCGGRFPLARTWIHTHFVALRVVASSAGTDKALVLQACGPLVPGQ